MSSPIITVNVSQCSRKHDRCVPKWRVHLLMKQGGIQYELSTRHFTEEVDAEMVAEHLRRSVTVVGVLGA